MATAFIKEPKEITFCESPQFITIQDIGGVSPATSLVVEIFIWTGLKASPPVSATNTLNLIPTLRTDIGPLATQTDFEISRFIRELIDSDNHVETDSTTYNGDNGVWYYYTALSDTSTKITSDTRFALNGWGQHSEGTNPGTTIVDENGKVFGTHSNNIIYDDNSDYMIPVYIGDTSTNAEIQSVIGGDFDFVIDLGYTLNSTDSGQQIAYIRIGKTLYGGTWVHDKFIDYIINDTLSTSTREYRATIQCFKGDIKSVKYINSFGVLSHLPIRGKSEETITAKRTRYSNLVLDELTNYDPLQHARVTFDVNGRRIFNVSTNWMYEDSNEMIEELMLSKYVWLEVGSDVWAVVVTDTSKKLINRTWASQVGYDLTLEEAAPIINQVL